MNNNFRKFRKVATKIGIISIIAFSSSISINAMSYKSQGITTTKVNLREQTTKNSNIIAKINAKESVEILDFEGDWYKVKYNNQDGYI